MTAAHPHVTRLMRITASVAVAAVVPHLVFSWRGGWLAVSGAALVALLAHVGLVATTTGLLKRLRR